MELPQSDDADKEKEVEFRRQKEAIKKLLRTGDECFINGRSFAAAAEAFGEAETLARKLEPRSQDDMRYKKCVQRELRRRAEMVMTLIPKEKQKDLAEQMKERKVIQIHGYEGNGVR